jgi:hypothetical protein
MSNSNIYDCKNCGIYYCIECSDHEHWEEFCCEECYEEYCKDNDIESGGEV